MRKTSRKEFIRSWEKEISKKFNQEFYNEELRYSVTVVVRSIKRYKKILEIEDEK
jgi:hypothetical protein